MTSLRPDRNLAIELVRTTEAAALAAARFQGYGAKEAGDQAAVDAMRQTLSTVSMDGTVVIGEGEKDEAPMLYNGERVGDGSAPAVDIAVDPIDGTRLLAEGRPGAIAVIAAATRGSMFDPGPCFYMDKLIVGPEAVGLCDIDAPVADNLAKVAKAKGKKVADLTVVMLDRPRHTKLRADVRAAGARINLITDGDVAGGILAAWDQKAPDVLMGIGGTPEGVTTACAVRALGGEILGKLWPHKEEERRELIDLGYDLDQVYTTNDLVKTDDCFFSCTGVTTSQLLGGVWFDGRGAVTHSLVMRGKSGTVRVVEARHTLRKVAEVAPAG
jgi:fructose-1,6-bisphosphatase II